MEKGIFAIYDPDPEFVFRFMDFIRVRSVISMEVRACTSEEHLRQLCEKTPPELLLISSSVLTEEVRKLEAGTKVILLEDRELPPDNMPGVYKYQAPEELLHRVLDFCEWKQEMTALGRSRNRMRIIGVWSPVGRTRKTSFALVLGQILSASQPVLYLNLETFSGFEQLFGEYYERTLSDLLYFGRQKDIDLQEKLRGIVCRLGSLDYVPPAVSPEDLQNTEQEEWMALLGQLESQTGYDTVILDLGEAVQGLLSVLAVCDRIYMPVRKDPMAQAKLDQFFWILEELQGREAADKIRKVEVPLCLSSKKGKEFFTDLVRTEIGDLVRKELSEEAGV